MEYKLLSVWGLLNAEQNEAIKRGDSEIPCELRWSATCQSRFLSTRTVP